MKMKIAVNNPKKKKSTENYVDNAKLYEAFVQRRKDLAEAKEKGLPTPRVSEYIGECILKIAQRLAYRPNFMSYTFRDEMVSDGIENCLTYVDNFDPEKSKNPFSYLTQVIYFAFVRRITKEKKQTYIKYKCIEAAHGAGTFEEWSKRNNADEGSRTPGIPNLSTAYLKISSSDIQYFEGKDAKKEKKASSTKKPSSKKPAADSSKKKPKKSTLENNFQ